jgi:GNAT superfamily N-acetyltransferase
MKSNIHSVKKLERDRFGIPILPKDRIKVNENGDLDATVFVYIDISEDKEKYAELEFRGISKNRILPPFTYTKPDPKDKDPRLANNISYIDEKAQGKVLENYILLGLLPFDGCGFDKAWGMRNHLHKPITKDNPGIVCAVYNNETNKWSTRTYFKSDSIEFLNGYDVIKTCYRVINKTKINDWEKALKELVCYLRSIGIDDFQLISAGLHYVYGAKIYPHDIDIFVSRQSVEQAYFLLEEIAISDLHEFKNETGSYLEFQEEINGIPFELCEWSDEPKNLVDINFKGTSIRGLSLKDEIENYEGRDKDERIALLKSIDIRIDQAIHFLAEDKVVHQMRENLHTKDGTISKADDFDEKLEELRSAFKEGRGYVAMDSYNNPVGYVTWVYHDENHKYVSDAIFISELYVFPEYRMSGIGRMLVKHVLEEEAVVDKTIWLTHDPDELGLTYFYRNFGFEERGKTDAGNVIMVKE